MKTKHLAIAIIAIVMLSSVTLLTTAKATPWPNLPSATVQLTVVNGTTSYFISALSGVPPGFDVYNGVYPGWCVDRATIMNRSVSINVKLYSSLSPPTTLSSINWIAINYILNHKLGTMLDVQDAIWYFSDGYSSISATAQAMVDAANAHPTYDPTKGAILAVICLPQTTNWNGKQISIIELTHGTGKVTGGGQCIVGDDDEVPSASFGFNAMWFSRDPTPKGELNYIDHTTGMHVHIHTLTYLQVWEDLPGNKPYPLMKATFGGPCTIDGIEGYFADVYVEDHGEPGTNDKFQITLSTGYVGGSDTVPMLVGNIQIHKPPM